MNSNDKMKMYAPAILRIGIALVFIWFGASQLLNSSEWISLIPKWAISLSHVSANTLVHFNGAFEVVFGLALLLGWFTRITAFFLALHMISITFDVGYTSIGIRDFGLSMAAIAIFLHGSHHLSIDAKLENKGNDNFIKTS